MPEDDEFISCGIEHAVVLQELHLRSFGKTAWSSQSLIEILAQSSNHGLLFSNGGIPAGFVLWQEVAGEAEILTICVDPAARRKGYSRVLLSKMIERLKQAGAVKVFLEVAEDNLAALGLYKSMKFSEIARRVGYYQKHETGPVDAIVMTLDI